MGCGQSNTSTGAGADYASVPINKWTNDHVVEWLRTYENGVLKPLIKPFTKQNITGVVMIKLTEDVLKEELGVTQYGTRVTFIEARDELLKQNAPLNTVRTASVTQDTRNDPNNTNINNMNNLNNLNNGNNLNPNNININNNSNHPNLNATRDNPGNSSNNNNSTVITSNNSITNVSNTDNTIINPTNSMVEGQQQQQQQPPPSQYLNNNTGNNNNNPNNLNDRKITFSESANTIGNNNNINNNPNNIQNIQNINNNINNNPNNPLTSNLNNSNTNLSTLNNSNTNLNNVNNINNNQFNNQYNNQFNGSNNNLQNTGTNPIDPNNLNNNINTMQPHNQLTQARSQPMPTQQQQQLLLPNSATNNLNAPNGGAGGAGGGGGNIFDAQNQYAAISLEDFGDFETAPAPAPGPGGPVGPVAQVGPNGMMLHQQSMPMSANVPPNMANLQSGPNGAPPGAMPINTLQRPISVPNNSDLANQYSQQVSQGGGGSMVGGSSMIDDYDEIPEEVIQTLGKQGAAGGGAHVNVNSNTSNLTNSSNNTNNNNNGMNNASSINSNKITVQPPTYLNSKTASIDSGVNIGGNNNGANGGNNVSQLTAQNVAAANGGRYNSVQLQDMALDENDLIINNSVPSMQSVVSQTPSSSTHNTSNADANSTLRVGQTQVIRGGIVEAWLPTHQMWAKAKLLDQKESKFEVAILPGMQHMLVDAQAIRVISPPTRADGGSTVNTEQAASALNEYVNPTDNMTEEEKQIHEFAREVWKTLHKIEVKVVQDANGAPIRGFSGKQLLKHVEKFLKEKVKKNEVHSRCQDLVSHKYIRLIASAKNKNVKQTKFENSEKYLYQFENEKHRQFIKDEQPDRRAWTRGTKLLINSSTLGGWREGCVVEVNNRDTLTITYGPQAQQMRKILDRYQDDVKSTEHFVRTRKMWKEGSKVEVYSQGQQIWCPGRIDEVLEKKEGQPYDIFRVFYTNNDDKDYSKYVDRWSDMLREVQTLNEALAKYKKGTRVMVWSNSSQSWTEGVVIDVVEAYEVVNVRYADHEKLVPIHSNVIRLLDEQTPNTVAT